MGQYFLVKILENATDKKEPNKGNPLENKDENMDDEDAPLSMSNVHLKNL